MLRTVLRSFVIFLLVTHCRSSVRSAGVDEAAITDEIQESKTRRPFLLHHAEVALFHRKYHERFGAAPTFVLDKGEHAVFLLNVNEDQDPAFTGINLRSAGKAPPFVFFDPGYVARLRRGFVTLEDLMTGYKDPALNEMLLAGIAKAYPDVTRLHHLGMTGMGRTILALELTSQKSPRTKIPLLFSAAMHGNELTATEHCYQILYEILNNKGRYSEVLDRLSLWIVPLVNPDGNQLFWHESSLMGRKNATLGTGQPPGSPLRGVDINRNFPFRWNSGYKKASSDDPNNVYFRGRAPASERETQAMIRLAEKERFLYSVSFHAVSGKILVPYTIENVKNPMPDYAWAFAREIVPKIRPHNARRGFRAVKNIYPVDGTDQDYYFFKYGTLAYIVESSYRNCDYRHVPYYLEGYQPLWEGILAEYAANYKFVLRIIDSEGNPVGASVRFSDVTWFEGEDHTANPRDGYFYRLTKSPAAAMVTVSSRGYRTAVLEIKPQGQGYPSAQVIVLEKKEGAMTGAN